MNELKIKKIIELGVEVENFCDCYEGHELWGDRDSFVPASRLIEFLVDHPEFQEIANNIRKLNNS